MIHTGYLFYPFCPPLKKGLLKKKSRVLLVQLLWKTLWQFLQSQTQSHRVIHPKSHFGVHLKNWEQEPEQDLHTHAHNSTIQHSHDTNLTINRGNGETKCCSIHTSTAFTREEMASHNRDKPCQHHPKEKKPGTKGLRLQNHVQGPLDNISS